MHCISWAICSSRFPCEFEGTESKLIFLSFFLICRFRSLHFPLFNLTLTLNFNKQTLIFSKPYNQNSILYLKKKIKKKKERRLQCLEREREKWAKITNFSKESFNKRWTVAREPIIVMIITLFYFIILIFAFLFKLLFCIWVPNERHADRERDATAHWGLGGGASDGKTRVGNWGVWNCGYEWPMLKRERSFDCLEKPETWDF